MFAISRVMASCDQQHVGLKKRDLGTMRSEMDTSISEIINIHPFVSPSTTSKGHNYTIIPRADMYDLNVVRRPATSGKT
mgnify:FL=1